MRISEMNGGVWHGMHLEMNKQPHLLSRVLSLLSSAQRRVVIVSAYVKSRTLKTLLAQVNPKASIEVYARWRLDDLVRGASDVKAYDVVRKRGGEFRIHETLHAKMYVADNRALIGSANATNSGLNERSKKANLELLYECSASCKEVCRVLDVLREKAKKPFPVDEKMLQNLLQNSSNLDFDGIIVDELDDMWLPRSEPENIRKFVTGRRFSKDIEFLQDCCALDLSQNAGMKRTREAIKEKKVFRVLHNALERGSGCMSEEQILNCLDQEFQTKNLDLKAKLVILQKWIEIFSDNLYVQLGVRNRIELRSGRKLRSIALVSKNDSQSAIN